MTASIIRKLQARFDGVPDHLVASIARAALAEAGQAKRLDGQVRFDGGTATPARAARSDGLDKLRKAQADAFAGRADTAPEPARATRFDGLAKMREAQNAHFKGAA